MQHLSTRFVSLVILISLLVAPTGLAGCRRSQPEQLYQGQQTIQFDDLERTFNIHLPPDYDISKDWPLVFVFHGGGGNAGQVERSTGFSDLADEEGFIVVYPNGTGVFQSALLTWNAGHCCGYALENDVDDVGFFKEMLSTIKLNLNIDERHVYATGMSNGAMMAYRLGVECSGDLTAIAPVAGAIGGRASLDAPLWLPPLPSHPVSVLAIHGTDDPHVLYDGGHGPSTTGTRVDVSVADSIDFWIRVNSCELIPEVIAENPWVERSVHKGGRQGTVVELITIEGGDHVWPGADKDPLAKLDAPALSGIFQKPIQVTIMYFYGIPGPLFRLVFPAKVRPR